MNFCCRNESEIQQARLLVESQRFQSLLSFNQTTNSSLFQGSFGTLSNITSQDNISFSYLSSNETNSVLNQTDLANITNQDFQTNLTQPNATLNNSSTGNYYVIYAIFNI